MEKMERCLRQKKKKRKIACYVKIHLFKSMLLLNKGSLAFTPLESFTLSNTHRSHSQRVAMFVREERNCKGHYRWENLILIQHNVINVD